MSRNILLLSIFCCAALAVVSGAIDTQHRKLQAAETEVPPVTHHHHCPSLKFIPPIKSREHLGEILKEENLKIGAELGVQSGAYAREILDKWQVCEQYVMVDVWAHIPNYVDAANVGNGRQNELYTSSMNVLEDMKKKGFLKEGLACRNYTSNCFQNYPDHHFDFIYVDASHNYKVLIFSRFFHFQLFSKFTIFYFFLGRSAGSSSVVA